MNLLKRLQTESGREEDARVFCTVNNLYFGRVRQPCKKGSLIWARRIYDDGSVKEKPEPFVAPPYTSSVDHALTLVPKHMSFSVCPSITNGGWMAMVDEVEWFFQSGKPCKNVGNADTPQNAIVIAALKARGVE